MVDAVADHNLAVPFDANVAEPSARDNAVPAARNHAAPLAPKEAEPFVIDSVSQPFVGQWYTLVSTTNWEKGSIICQWRARRIAEGLAASHFSDEAWAHMVGNVTSQHVGRLRRVSERFGSVVSEYAGLYWSHFHAAIDWTDAEMWLEGALQNKWSVTGMRDARRQATEGSAENYPAESDVLEQSIDAGDYHTAGDGDFDTSAKAELAEVTDPDAVYDDGTEATGGPEGPTAAERSTEPKTRPFAELPELPEDVSEAFEQFKLAILHHKLGGWSEVSRDDLLAALASLKQLALAPSE